MPTTLTPQPLHEIHADALLVPYRRGEHPWGASGTALNAALGDSLQALADHGNLPGQLGHVTPLFPSNSATPRVLLVGLGSETPTLHDLRHAMGDAARAARTLGAHHLAAAADDTLIASSSAADTVQAIVEGVQLGLYRYHRDSTHTPTTTPLTISAGNPTTLAASKAAGARADAGVAGVLLARELVNRPPNVATPSHLADVAEQLAATHGFHVTIGDHAWIEREKMGLLLAVTQGSGVEARFIVLEHNPSGSAEAPRVLVGKGVTFDSGGLSIKTRDGMVPMKSDMAGAAAVLGVMDAIGRLQVQQRVVAIIPASENMLDARGYRPSDVHTASDGTTIEIISTDAEGRLLLAEALVYARRFNPRAVVNVATLTGAVVTSLGRNTAAGLFGNDDTLQAALQNAARATNERVWPLPAWDDYLQDIKSDVADMKNSSGEPVAGAPVAAVFLKHFVRYPWAHLDIAGMALRKGVRGFETSGATGYSVRLLLQWLLDT